MCRNMLDIQSVTAEIRRRKKEEPTGQKYNVRICYAGVQLSLFNFDYPSPITLSPYLFSTPTAPHLGLHLILKYVQFCSTVYTNSDPIPMT